MAIIPGPTCCAEHGDNRDGDNLVRQCGDAPWQRDEQGNEREYLRQSDLKLVVLFLSCSHHIVL